MFKLLLILFIAVIVGFAALVTVQPADFRVTRSTVIEAEPAKIFTVVNDFHQWENWSPWAKLDPQAKNSFEGPSNGTGAIFRWAGNKEVGEGSMAIVESAPSSLIRIRLDFLKPFKATHMAEFSFKVERSHTLVTWSMYGKNNFFAKAVGLFMNCDTMLGGYFEKGLAQMKAVVEK